MIEFWTEDEVESFKYLIEFEYLHPKNLQWNKEDRRSFFEISNGRALWMVIDDDIAAEILWNKEKSSKKSGKIAYIDSISIKKKYQGKGYSKILKIILYNFLKNAGYTEVRGHAREGKSWETSKKLGAKLIKTIEDYEGTGEKYHYYKQKLN